MNLSQGAQHFFDLILPFIKAAAFAASKEIAQEVISGLQAWLDGQNAWAPSPPPAQS